jgi:DNA-binding NarL/FixJ family response regulator
MTTCSISKEPACIADRQSNSTCIRVLIVEDRFLVRQGLRRYLSHHVDIALVGEANNWDEAVKLADGLKPDVVVMDTNVLQKNGSEGTGFMRSTHPHLPVIGLPFFFEKENRAALDDGACLLVEKRTVYTHLPQAIYQAVGKNPHADLPSHRRVA